MSADIMPSYASVRDASPRVHTYETIHMILQSKSPPFSRFSPTARWSRALSAISVISLAIISSVKADSFNWDFATATPNSTITNLNVPTITQYNNSGTTTLLTPTSASTTYVGASGGNNAGASAKVGALGTAPGGSAAFEFTLVPSSGYQFALTGISFGSRSTATGPQAYSLRSSLDGYASDIATGTFLANSTWALKSNTGLTLTSGASTTFRLFGYSGTGSPSSNTANWRLDDLVLTLTVTSSGTDTTPPTITTLSPANGATNVAAGTNLVATFSEAIVVNAGNITITKAAGDVVAATISVTDATQVSSSGGLLTIDPTADLEFSTNYYIKIDAGAVKDIAGNSFTGIASTTTWAFKTIAADVTPPALVSTVPANGSTDILPPTVLMATYSEPLQTPSFDANIRIKDSTNATVATFTSTLFGGSGIAINGSTVSLTVAQGAPGTALGYGKTYYVEFDTGAFEDLSGNPTPAFAGNSTWQFTTANVPDLTATPYAQTFAGYMSTATLPNGWSFSGSPGFISDYEGDFGTVTTDPNNPNATLGGFKGNASTFGYAHSSTTGTSGGPLLQTLTLRNSTGAPITDLSVSYKGRVGVLTNTRLPAYTLSLNGAAVTELSYSTGDGDSAQRNSSIGGLTIAAGTTFQISWASTYPTGAGSARQIGISDVVVKAGASVFAPNIGSLAIPPATTGSLSADTQANVLGNGGAAVTSRGFVFSATSANATPAIGGTGVTVITDTATGTGVYSGTLHPLTPGTDYSVRGYATNSAGTSYTGVVTFNSTGASPSFVNTYTQDFLNYDGNNPPGWTAISDAFFPIQNFVGAWGTGASTGGFLGLASDPGVLGYRHTGSTGNLVVTLRLINSTGGVLTGFNVSYKGRVNDTTAGRSPQWSVSVEGSPPIAALGYDTSLLVDAVKSTTLSGLSIPVGAEFSISWTSDRGGPSGSSKQIGITGVSITTGAAPSGYASYAIAHAGGQGPTLDFDNDGVKNGVEYFFGATGSSFTANPALVGNTISYPKSATATGVTGTIQTSPDLVIWTDVTADTSTPGFLKYTLPPSAPAAPKLFVRLNVVVTP